MSRKIGYRDLQNEIRRINRQAEDLRRAHACGYIEYDVYYSSLASLAVARSAVLVAISRRSLVRQFFAGIQAAGCFLLAGIRAIFDNIIQAGRTESPDGLPGPVPVPNLTPIAVAGPVLSRQSSVGPGDRFFSRNPEMGAVSQYHVIMEA